MEATLQKSTAWTDILRLVEDRLTQDVFDTWFRPIKFEGIDDEHNLIRLRAGQVTKDWVCMYYSDLIEQSMGELVLTDYSIEVSESIKGQASRSMVVTTVGGRMGDTELHVAGMPAFQKGEDAVLFVEQTGAYRTVVGLGQGKFTVVNGEVANDVGDLSFPDGRPGNPVRMPLNTFRNQIRNIVNRQP